MKFCFESLAAILMLVSLGCTPTRAIARFAQTQQHHGAAMANPQGVLPAPPPVGPVDDCELRLYIEQVPNAGAFGLDAGQLGVAAVEQIADDVANTPAIEAEVVDGVCIKRAGKDIELPAAILLAGTSDGPTLKRFCHDDQKSAKAVTNGQSVDVEVCTWDGTFHAARPFTFTFESKGDATVGDLIDFIRIYRNGDLMAAWNRASDHVSKTKVVLNGRTLRTGFLSASLPPHRSALDLRVIPRGATAEVVDLKVRKDEDRFKTRIQTALGEAYDAALTDDQKKALQCLREKVAHAKVQISEVIHGNLLIPQLQGGCTLDLPGDPAKPLDDAYATARNQSDLALARVHNDASERLDELRSAIEKSLPAAALEAFKAIVDKASDKVQDTVRAQLAAPVPPALEDFAELLEKAKADPAGDPATIKDLEAMLVATRALIKDADRQLQELLRIIDETRVLASSLYQNAKEIVKSPDRQVEIFNAVAASLHNQGDVFEARRDNPAPLAGEQLIPMEYADYFQGFVLAPWNAVPFRSGEAELSGGLAIPFVDVVGARLQWDKSRLADLRAAFGIGYVQIERVSEDESTSKTYRVLPNVSIGLANFKFGAGMALGKGFEEDSDRVRLLLGADLYKLLSGNNVELF